MIYVCKDCGFLFCRVEEVKECPACEKNHINSATEEAIQRLQTLLKQRKLTSELSGVLVKR